jgi:hypothetical protein
MAITPSLVFPVTDEQIEAFSIWAKNKYGTYNSYLVACKTKAPAIDKYIRTYILPMEMKSVLRETEPYIGIKGVDFHISRFQIYHQRILNKIKYMKYKLGRLAFPDEANQIRIDKRIELLRRRQAILAHCLKQKQYYKEDASTVNYGHQFGRKWLAKWNRILTLFAGQKTPKQPCF